jgi:L,D-transpeptidase catalytic domain/Putative peptidoglycan binding domain
MRALIAAVVLIAVLPAQASAAGTTPVPGVSSPPTGAPGPTTPATSTPTSAPKPATQLVGLPSKGLHDGTRALVVLLSAPVAAGSPSPTLEPTVAGSWTVSGAEEVFKPASTLTPCSTYTLTVWAGTQASEHPPLGRKVTDRLHVDCPPIAGLQEALARLGYLGAALRPPHGLRLPEGRETPRQAAVLAFDPAGGRLLADPSYAPSVRFGELDEATRGALMVYQGDHELPVTGSPDESTWASLLAAETAYRRDRNPYTWVTVTESLPETLEVHEGDRVVLSTPVNTGVAGAETQQGVFPIYSRLISTSMSGTDPDGVSYDVPDVPWVNYFNGGDAVHGYPRASYGFPQSNGCVELPIETARTVYGMLAIGDLVEVMG